jgi:hypothetical protein
MDGVRMSLVMDELRVLLDRTTGPGSLDGLIFLMKTLEPENFEEVVGADGSVSGYFRDNQDCSRTWDYLFDAIVRHDGQIGSTLCRLFNMTVRRSWLSSFFAEGWRKVRGDLVGQISWVSARYRRGDFEPNLTICACPYGAHR